MNDGASAPCNITFDTSKFSKLTIGSISSNTSDTVYYCYLAIKSGSTTIANYLRTGTNLSYDISKYSSITLYVQASSYNAGRSISLSNIKFS